MNINDVEALKNWLTRIDVLEDADIDLIDNAIWCLKNGYDYRAVSSLNGLASNFRKAGKSEAAKAVARLL